MVVVVFVVVVVVVLGGRRRGGTSANINRKGVAAERVPAAAGKHGFARLQKRTAAYLEAIDTLCQLQFSRK